MDKRFSIRIKTISFFFLFFFSCVALVAQTTTFYDFNTSGQLATYFNGYGPQLGNISEQTTGGVSNSGSLSIPLSVTNAVFSSKDSYSMSAVGSTYRFESVIRSQGGNGYSGLGFTTTSPTSSISITYPSSGGNTYRPASGIGVSVAGGGFIFHNGATDYLGYFNPPSVGQPYNPSITYVKTSICSGPINSTNSDGYFSCASPDGWYKLVLIVEKTGTSTFNMHLEIWRCNSEGVLLDDEAASIMELNGVTNTAIASAPSIYSYFNFSGIRFTRFDNYSISLSGGATVVTAGNPVVLTTAATQNTNATSFALSGNVTAANGTVSERGFVYGTSTNPTIANNKLTSGTGTGTFTVNTPSLTPGTYYFRSFATNASGTSYGEEFVRATDLSVLGGITIVSSGGDVEGTKWLYSNNTIFPTSNLAVNLNASDVLAKLALGNLTISGANITVNSDVINLTNSYSLQLNSTGSINQNNGISTNGTITILGGNVFLNANLTSTLSSAPILLQATGYISVSGTIQTNNGDITLRSNAGGTAVVLPDVTTGAITLNNGSSLLSNGGNITLGGNFDGTKGVGLYATSGRTGGSPGVLINNATLNAGGDNSGGNINIYGRCSTSYDDGIRLQANISTSGSGNIGIYGDAFGGYNGTQYFGGISFFNQISRIETENGDVTLEGILTNSQHSNGYAISFYRSSGQTGQTKHIQILSKTGNIQITADRGETIGQGIGHSSWGHIYFGSPSDNSYIASGDIKFTYSNLVHAGNNGFKVKTTGAVTYEPVADSFTVAQTLPANSNYILAESASSLMIGKSGNTASLTISGNETIAGPITVYGGYVNINGTLTSSANGDILLKGIANANSSVLISSVGGITKSAGTGTLTMQGNGRTQNSGVISATGTGELNVVMWSDFDGDNVGGGSTLSAGGSISTNGGHVWMGGSSTNAGSYNWNGLAVGDGPSVGASGANGNAIDIFGPITTNGGDLLLWAGNGFGGSNGIATNLGWQLNVGDGDIILITDVILGEGPSLFFKQSGGSFTLVPNGGDFGTTFNWDGNTNTVSGVGTGWNFGGNFNYLWLENPASLTSLTIGKYEGMLNGTAPVVLSNSSNVTFSNTTATSIAGPINVYGGDITISQNLSTTNTTTGNILFNGTRILGTGNIAIASGRTATINLSSNSTYDGIISGTGSGLTKLGAGLLTLTKDHTYSGATTISGGDLQVGTGGSVDQASSGSISNTTAVTVESGSKLILTPNEDIVFTAPISGAGGVEIKGASGAYYNSYLTATAATIATNSTVLEVLTRITGGFQLSANVNGTAGTYHKSYNAATNTATFQFQQFEGTFTKCVFVQLLQSGNNVQIRGNTSIYNGAAYRSGNHLGADMSTGSIQIGPGLATSSGGTGYGISKVYMSGKVNFTGNLTYTGNTSLSNTVTNGVTGNLYSYTSKGTQEITDSSSSFPSSSTVVNNGLVILNRTTPLTIASNMEGTEEVLQVGAAVTLTGTNTHTGNTTIDLNKSLLIGNGSTSGSISGNIINYGSLTFNRSDDSSYAGIISGSGTLTKLGDGLHTLTGLNSYTGATTITEGKLILERDIPATSSTSFSGSGHLVIQPSSNSFTNAITYPIAGFNIASTVGGLTIGKPSNTSNITFGSATTIAGSITVYGGTITANASLATTNSSNAPILLQGNKVFQNQGVLVQTNGSNITYDVTNSPWTTASDQGISLGTADGTIATINAQGGDISLASSFASTGVTNTSINPDVAILLRNSKIKTSGSGTVTLNGNAYDNASTNGDFIWGLMLHTNEVIQTEHGAISITGTGGKANGNARGIIADNTVLKVLSVSGPITFTEVMPNGHSVANHTGTYFKPSATESIKIGADGTLVANSTSNVVFDVARITFDGIIAPTVVNTSGTVTIQPVGNQFEGAVSLAGLSLSNTATGLTVGKSTNTANITFANATIIAGPIIAYGGDIDINGALTATNSSINLQALGTVTQTDAIAATNLDLSGTGTFTLTNTSNNVGTIAGGTISSKLGSLSYVDSNELAIGALTNPGIIASGKINIQTLTNNLNLNSNVVTDNTATDAIILNAGGSASIGTTTGGDIIVSGTPSVTTGANGIAKLYSGSNVNSTGLATLVGGLTNVRYETDETTTTFVPALETGNSYAFYRESVSIAPAITSFSPTIAGKGETVVITGSGFTGVTSVLFGSQAATSFIIISDTQISAVVNNGASGSVSVTNGAGSNAKSGFIFKVVEYNFENNTLDSTGANLDASLVGSASYSSGASGQAICFDNTYTNGTTVANYLTLPSNLIRGQGTDFTISLRFKTATQGALLGYQNKNIGNPLFPDGNWIPLLYVQNDGKIASTIWLGGTSLNAISSTVVNDNNWHKIDMSISAGAISIYVDNVLEATSTGNITHLDMTFNQLGAAAVSNYFGRTGNWEGFNGCIDDFMILDRALTSNELQQVTATIQPTAINQSVCTGSTVSDLVASGQDLKWYATLEGVQALASNTAVVAGTYYVSQTLSGNESARTAVVVTITPTVGSIGSISGPTSIASNATTATYSVPAVTGATSYVWNLPPGMTITSSTGNEIQVSISSTFSGGNVTVKAINTCTESSVRSLSVSKQNIPLTITGSSIICIAEGSVTESYSIPPVAGVTSYVWTVPSGSVITSGINTNSISLTYNASFTRGTIRVSATGAQGVISSGTLTVSGIAVPVAIVGATQICTAGTYEYSITAVDGATSYEWILPLGMTLQGAATGTSIVVSTSSSVSGTISVRAISSCGSSQPRTLSISGVATPGYIYGERIICGATSNAVDINGNVTTTLQNGVYIYSILPVLGADSYTWTLPTGVTLESGQGTRSIQVSFASGFVSGSITVVANSTSCGTSPSRPVSVSSANASIGGPSNVCGLTTATYSVSAGVGSNYVWSLPQGMTIESGEGTNSITVTIEHPINFSNNNQVTLSFTTPCGGTKVVNMTVDCPDYSNLTNCGGTVVFNERVYTRSVSGASMYAFDIYDSTTDALLNTYETQGNFFQFVQALPSFEFGTTYDVKVRVKKNGIYGTAGSSCALTIARPTTAIQSSQCNQTVLLQDRVYAASVWSGVTYAFDIYDSEGALITTIEKTSNFFRMSEFASIYGMSYQIGVRVKRGNGSYGEQGSRCNITIAIPTTSLTARQCGASVNITDRIYAISVANATMYAFAIYDSNGAFIAELERPYNFFRITDIAYAYSSIYTVKVRIKQGIGMFGEYGTICSIETPKDAIKRETISVADHSVLSAYPNPFTTAFTITPLEGETATLFYQVYDITGKMLESKSVEASEITNHTIGADYPVGMYLVIVRQGATTQTFKMIKQ